MSSIPEGLKYSVEHEWLKVEGAEGVVGVTAYAAEQVSDIVYVDLPAVGTVLTQGMPFGNIESVKAVSELFAPVNGTVVEVNAALANAPESISNDPYGAGWLVRVQLAGDGGAGTLMDAAAYAKHIGQ